MIAHLLDRWSGGRNNCVCGGCVWCVFFHKRPVVCVEIQLLWFIFRIDEGNKNTWLATSCDTVIVHRFAVHVEPQGGGKPLRDAHLLDRWCSESQQSRLCLRRACAFAFFCERPHRKSKNAHINMGGQIDNLNRLRSRLDPTSTDSIYLPL